MMDAADHYLWMHFELLAEAHGYDDLRTMTALEAWLRSFRYDVSAERWINLDS